MKKIVLLALSLTLALSAAACGAAPAASSAASTAESSATVSVVSSEASVSESSAAEVSSEASVSETSTAVAGTATGFSAYESWTSADWETATEEEKMAVGEALVIAVGEQSMPGYAELYKLSMADPSQKEAMDAVFENMLTSVDAFFAAAPNSTLGELYAASVSVIDQTTAAE